MPEKTKDDFFEGASDDMDEHREEDEGPQAADEWDPAEGGVLRGVFLKAVRKSTNFGPGYNVIVKDIDTELIIKVWCLRSMLKQQLLDASPAAGSPIVFKYNGEKEGSGDYPFHSYQVRAEKSDPALWAELTKPDAEELEEMAAKAASPVVATASSLPPDEAPF